MRSIDSVFFVPISKVTERKHLPIFLLLSCTVEKRYTTSTHFKKYQDPYNFTKIHPLKTIKQDKSSIIYTHYCVYALKLRYTWVGRWGDHACRGRGPQQVYLWDFVTDSRILLQSRLLDISFCIFWFMNFSDIAIINRHIG